MARASPSRWTSPRSSRPSARTRCDGSCAATASSCSDEPDRRERRMSRRGIIAAAGYVPYRRLQRREIGAFFGAGGGRGTRSVASYDEDTTTMGVEAARAALRATAARPAALWFATADPAYLEKTNATAIHAALRLEPDVVAIDSGGAVRSGVGSLLAA